ncbi:unnamed protein product [Caenorhabditis brenneri]
MKLLKLPYLAYDEIIKAMGYCEVLKLSTCSSRMYHNIRCVKLDGVLEVAADKSSVWIDKWDKQNQIMHLKILDTFEEGSFIMKIKMDKVDFECTWIENQIRIVRPSHIEVTVAIYRHVLNLIKFSKKIQLDFLIDQNEVDNFPVLEGVTATAIREIPIDTTIVEAFCLKYPYQKSMILTPKLLGGLDQNSPILKVEEICFLKTEKLISTFLESFSGRVAFFSKARCRENPFIKFIRDWMTGSAHENLEVLDVSFDTGYFLFPHIILEEFDTERKEWDPTKRPESYEIDTKMAIKQKTINCSHYWDIERRCDGRLASFVVTSFQFRFFVWNQNCSN